MAYDFDKQWARVAVYVRSALEVHDLNAADLHAVISETRTRRRAYSDDSGFTQLLAEALAESEFLALRVKARRDLARFEAPERPALRPALGLLYVAGLVLDHLSRERYVAEWRAEVAAIEGRRAQLGFALSLLATSPRLAVAVRRATARRDTG